MMTVSKYHVAWTYRGGDTIVCRALHSTKVAPCIEAARLINGNPFAYDVKVFETDSGKEIGWVATEIGRVLDPDAKTDLSWDEIPPAKVGK